jgi:hypothetical protein
MAHRSSLTEHSNLEMRPIVDPVYAWRDHSRYVELVPVQTGWLVLWGLYEEQGAVKHIYGQRVYRNLEGVRRRLADQVIAFTGKPAEARDALALLARQGLPEHRPAPLTTLTP